MVGFFLFGEWGFSVGVGLMYKKSHPRKTIVTLLDNIYVFSFLKK